MKFIKAELIISAAAPAQFPPTAWPEIAMVGRSNVGKSSLINTLLNRKGLARTSNTPGKTRLLNFYAIDDRFFFVDLPGYGFARVSKSERQQWGKLIETYLLKRPQLRCVLQLIDIRHEPGEHDRNMHAWLIQHGLPVVVVVTKADKIARGKWQQHLHLVQKALGLDEGQRPVLFSAEDGAGREALWRVIDTVLAELPAENEAAGPEFADPNYQ